MVRGYQKRVIFVKNTGSRIFDEAYFVLSEREPDKKEKIDMIAEANRIIEENEGLGKRRARGFLCKLPGMLLRIFVPFLLGALCAAAVCTAILI